jgi:hypothetical protein
MYFPQNWKFGSALSKLRNFGWGGGGWTPQTFSPRYATALGSRKHDRGGREALWIICGESFVEEKIRRSRCKERGHEMLLHNVFANNCACDFCKLLVGLVLFRNSRKKSLCFISGVTGRNWNLNTNRHLTLRVSLSLIEGKFTISVYLCAMMLFLNSTALHWQYYLTINVRLCWLTALPGPPDFCLAVKWPSAFWPYMFMKNRIEFCHTVHLCFSYYSRNNQGLFL